MKGIKNNLPLMENKLAAINEEYNWLDKFLHFVCYLKITRKSSNVSISKNVLLITVPLLI